MKVAAANSLASFRTRSCSCRAHAKRKLSAQYATPAGTTQQRVCVTAHGAAHGSLNTKQQQKCLSAESGVTLDPAATVLTSLTSRLSLSPSLISSNDRLFFAAALGVMRGLKVYSSDVHPLLLVAALLAPPLLTPLPLLAPPPLLAFTVRLPAVAESLGLLPLLPPLHACESDSCCSRPRKSCWACFWGEPGLLLLSPALAASACLPWSMRLVPGDSCRQAHHRAAAHKLPHSQYRMAPY